MVKVTWKKRGHLKKRVQVHVFACNVKVAYGTRLWILTKGRQGRLQLSHFGNKLDVVPPTKPKTNWDEVSVKPLLLPDENEEPVSAVSLAFEIEVRELEYPKVNN